MIEITGIQHRSLCISSLILERGKTFIIGPNGSGKTTLLRILAGIDIAGAGSVVVDGSSPRELDIGWVNEYPDRSLLFSRVEDEIASSLRFSGVSCTETEKRVLEIAEKTGIVHLLDRNVKDLSGGERVITAVAAALACNPSLMVLDEFDSHLDSFRCCQIDEAVRSIRPAYVIRCTQQMETAATGDCIIALDRGRISCCGRPKEVFELLKDTPYYPRSWRADPWN